MIVRVKKVSNSEITERFQADKEADVATYDTDKVIGSTILCLDTGEVYKLSSEKKWIKVP